MSKTKKDALDVLVNAAVGYANRVNETTCGLLVEAAEVYAAAPADPPPSPLEVLMQAALAAIDERSRNLNPGDRLVTELQLALGRAAVVYAAHATATPKPPPAILVRMRPGSKAIDNEHVLDVDGETVVMGLTANGADRLRHALQGKLSHTNGNKPFSSVILFDALYEALTTRVMQAGGR